MELLGAGIARDVTRHHQRCHRLYCLGTCTCALPQESRRGCERHSVIEAPAACNDGWTTSRVECGQSQLLTMGSAKHG
eukprot:230220-Chlamydomonas_euryale.AAC.4